jgi:hypothetical protein
MTAQKTSTRNRATTPEPEPVEETEEIERFREVQVELTDYDDDGRPITDEDGEPIKRVVPGREGTVHGITVQVADEALDDFELLDDLRSAQDDEDGTRLPSILRRLVGDDYRRVLNELRDPKTRRVSVEAGGRFVWDLFRALNPNS